MSQKRQTGIFDRSEDPNSAITTLSHDYPAGHVIPLHFHDRDQLVYASRGVMTVRTRSGTWVVPPHRAVWIPAEVPHTITMSGLVAMRTLYLKPRLAKRLPRGCCVINVSALLKELILHTCVVGKLKKSVKWQIHLIEVILHQLEAVQTIPLQLPHLSDPRLVRIAEILMNNPRDSRTLAQLCKGVWGGKTVCRKTVPTGSRNNIWEMAAAASAHAGDAAFGRGRKSDTRRSRVRLQYAERLHFHVQEDLRNNAKFVFSVERGRLSSRFGAGYPGLEA